MGVHVGRDPTLRFDGAIELYHIGIISRFLLFFKTLIPTFFDVFLLGMRFGVYVKRRNESENVG